MSSTRGEIGGIDAQVPRTDRAADVLHHPSARAEAAQLGMSKGRKYHELLADLHVSGALSDDEYESWSGVRRFRNVTTHTNEAMILPPGAAIGMFATIVASIDRLFARRCERKDE